MSGSRTLLMVMAMSFSTLGFANPRVQGTGRGESIISNVIASDQARAAANAEARAKCNQFGFYKDPIVDMRTEQTNAQYYRRLWHAWYSAVYECSNEAPSETSEFFEPLYSVNEDQNFYLFKRQLSWRDATRKCSKAGMRAPTWAELSENLSTLRGQTVNGISFDRMMYKLNCRGLQCPYNIWSGDAFVQENVPNDYAYYFALATPNQLQILGKETFMPALCITP